MQLMSTCSLPEIISITLLLSLEHKINTFYKLHVSLGSAKRQSLGESFLVFKWLLQNSSEMLLIFFFILVMTCHIVYHLG